MRFKKIFVASMFAFTVTACGGEIEPGEESQELRMGDSGEGGGGTGTNGPVTQQSCEAACDAKADLCLYLACHDKLAELMCQISQVACRAQCAR